MNSWRPKSDHLWGTIGAAFALAFGFFYFLITFLEDYLFLQEFFFYCFCYLGYFLLIPIKRALTVIVRRNEIHGREGVALDHLENQFNQEQTAEL